MGLPDFEIFTAFPAIGDCLALDEYTTSLSLLEMYADLFSKIPHDFYYKEEIG